jgi:hypothetical protein
VNVYLDIETLPGQSDLLMNSLRADADKEKAAARAPSNYKDEAKIAEYIAARHAEIDASVEDKRLKTSFDGMFGSIACIAYAFDDGNVFAADTVSIGNEATMLDAFYSQLSAMVAVEYQGGMASMDAVFIGHNIADFDLQFLKHRSIILGVRPPPALAKAMAAKPWDKCIADTMLMWSPSREKRVSLDKLCRALGVPGKGDFDGSMVAETWPVDPQKVIDYCKADVERVRAIYRRMTFA